MLTDKEIETLSQKFAAMLSGYVQRAHQKRVQQKVELVDEFVSRESFYQ